MAKTRLLIVDDDEDISAQLKWALIEDYEVFTAADRPGALAALASLPPAMPQGWRLRLLPDHRISLEAEEALDSPPTAVALVTRLVRFALALDPYLDRLEEAGTELPGSAKTWPG